MRARLPDRIHRWPTAHRRRIHGRRQRPPNRPDPAVEVDCHGGEIVGSWPSTTPPSAGRSPSGAGAATDVADSLGIVVGQPRAAWLEQQLRAAVTYATDIAAARRTLVAAMDRERRRIERDLHDGVQHHLTCLR